MRPALGLASLAGVFPAVVGATLTWGPETNLSLTATDSETGLNHRAIERTPDGVTHVVWAERDTPNATYRIWTRRFEGTSWTSAELIVDYLVTDPGGPGDDIGAKYPSLACASDGALHLFWHDYRVAGIANVEIFTKERAAGGAWDAARSADVRLTTTSHPETLGDNGYVPVPVAMDDGSVHVVWYDFRWDGSRAELCSKSRIGGGEWDLTPGDAADHRVTTDAAHSELCDVVGDVQGDVHAVWRSVDGGARVSYSKRAAQTGVWSAPVFVDGTGTVAGAPCAALAGDGRLHVVWPDSREGGRALWTRVREASGAWSLEERLTPPAHGADEPSMDSAEGGTLHLVWQDGRVSLLNREIFHRQLAPGSSWDVTGATDFRMSNAAGASTRPSVLARAGVVFVTWRDERDGNRELYVRRGQQPSSGAIEITSRAESLRIAPNPTRGDVRILRARAEGAVTVHDARGRLVRRLSGGVEIPWNTKDDAGRHVAAGVYFVCDLQCKTAARVTVLR